MDTESHSRLVLRQLPDVLTVFVSQGLASLVAVSEGGCLGAGTGAGSCPAAPFRALEEEIDHKSGCPGYAECCTEYGYCHPKVRAFRIVKMRLEFHYPPLICFIPN